MKLSLDEYLKVLKAVSSFNRFRILNLLYQHNRPIGQTELVEVLQAKKSNISRHAKILSKAGVITFWKTSRHIYYTLNPNLKIKSISSILKEYQDQSMLKNDLINLKKLSKSKI